MDLRGKTVNFLGDSITCSVGASSEKNGFVAVCAGLLGLKKANNYGLSGSRIARQSEIVFEHDRDFCLRAPEMDKNADAVVVFGGTNDYGHGDAPLGKEGDEGVYSFYGACKTLFKFLSETYAGKPVLVLTPLKRYNEFKLLGDGSKKTEGAPLIEYKRALEYTAGLYNFKVLDLYEKSGIEPQSAQNRREFCPDGLHPNDRGHEIIAGLIADFFENEF